MTEDYELDRQIWERLRWKTGSVWRDNPEESMYSEHNILAYRYSTDYLLAKLAEHVSVTVRFVNSGKPIYLDLKEWHDKYVAYTPYMRQKDYPIAPTPAQALKKLTLALCDAGILEKEG